MKRRHMEVLCGAVAVVLLALSSAGCVNLTTTCPDGTKVWGDGKCPDPSMPVSSALISQKCRVVRQDCLAADASGVCVQATPVNFEAISCGKNAQDACNAFCVNAGLPTVPYLNCSASPIGPGPADQGYCNKQDSPASYNVDCTNEGRICTHTSGSPPQCDTLSPDVTKGNRFQCLDGWSGPGISICSNLPDDSGKPLFANRVTFATYSKRSGACATSSALTSTDMMYRIPAGTPIPVSVGGSNVTLTTSGGRMVVSYRCDSTGEFCTVYEMKDFWLGLNQATIGGTTFKNIVFASAGSNYFKADKTLDTVNPGFSVSTVVDGVSLRTFYKPLPGAKFTGALRSAPFTFANTFDVAVKYGNKKNGLATARVTMNISGSTFNSAGTAGGVQINCGDNGAIPPFAADKFFSGGAGKTRTNVIDLSGVVNPAPMGVYQSQRYSAPFTYTIPGFVAGSSHTVRLHFAETNPANNAANKRKFNVAINGTTQISNLDLFATVGMNKAYVREFNLPANASGAYVIAFTTVIDSATISAIEVF